VRAPRQARNAFERIRADTLVGMAFSNLIAIAIIVTTAATLNKAGVTSVETSAQAAEALKPVAGEFAFILFGLGPAFFTARFTLAFDLPVFLASYRTS
jgi:Mn2+/Fe2+ NRAMP family transporter